MYYFSSDFHLGHFKIIEYTNRPFKTLEEMDSKIIKNINDIVGKEDTLYFLGDFCFCRSGEAPDSISKSEIFNHYRNQINCKNIIFIKGNHDGKRNGTYTITQNATIEIGGQRIFMCHDPKYAKEEFRFNFVGHVHTDYQFKKLTDKSTIVNLSVEMWNYRPVDITEILKEYSYWVRKGKKHYGS